MSPCPPAGLYRRSRLHQARVQARLIADHPRSYPDAPLAVDDRDTYQLVAAARELEALLLHEQARHLAEVRGMLATVTVSPSRTPSWTPRPSAWRTWNAATGSSASWRPASTPAASCWSWPASSTTTPLGCGGRPPPAWSTTARRRWRTCAGGWRRSSAPSCVATPTWLGPRPTLAPSVATTGWRGGGGAAGGPRNYATGLTTAAGCGSGRSGGLPTWTPSSR